MENALGEIDGWLIGALGLGLLIGWSLSWIISRSQVRAHIGTAESEVKSKTAELEALKHDLQQRDTRLSDQRAQIRSLNDEKANSERQSQDLQNDVDDLTAKIELLESSQSESSDEIQSLEDTVANLEQKLAAIQADHKTEIDKLSSDKKAQLDTLEAEFSRAKQALIDQQQSHAASVDKLNTEHRNAAGILEEKIAQLQAENDDISRQLQSAASEHEQTKQSLMALQAEVSAQQETRGNSAASVNHLQDQIVELNQSRDQLRGEISSLQSSLTIWQQKNQRLQNKLAETEGQVSRLQGEIEQTGNADPAYQRLLAIKDKEIAEQKERTRSTQARMLAANEELTGRDRKIAELDAQIDKLHARDRRELAALNRKLEQQQITHSAELESRAKREAEISTDAARLESQNKQLERRLENLERHSQQISEQTRTLEAELDRAKTQLQQKQREVDQQTREQGDLAATLSKTKAAVDSYRHRLDESIREVQAKVHANEGLRTKISQQSQTITDLEKTLAGHPLYGPPPTANGTLEGDAKPANLLSKKPATVDDLKRINGVGPKLEKMLNKMGIYRFDQIAAFKAEEVTWVDQHIESFKGRIYRDEWVKQAKKLCED